MNKEFFDLFVLIGGCGATFGLLFSIFIFVKRKSIRNLAKISILPMIFNINELMTFGLPIILNPIMFIPFIFAPIIAYTIAYVAIAQGFVPAINSSVEWTTPVFFSGYLATGSIRGTILQSVILFLGILIYAPFFRLYAREQKDNSETRMQELANVLKTSETNNKNVTLTELVGDCGNIAN